MATGDKKIFEDAGYTAEEYLQYLDFQQLGQLDYEESHFSVTKQQDQHYRDVDHNTRSSIFINHDEDCEDDEGEIYE
ncbi:hypothetical protein [Pseudoalteromonas phage J2-1_QLiu-2017]|nr:hypothetical protein [Pseudoalteromonas phage J2-1_QLiu-2017]